MSGFADDLSLVARTLAGSEYPLLVSGSCTVGELKRLICEQADGFKPDEIRLLKGPTPLSDDSKTVLEVGLKDKSTVHVVRSLQAGVSGSDGVVGAEVKSPSANIVTVTVPPGQGPGSRLLINPPGRRQMMVTVPDGVHAGSNFRVQLPPGSTTTTTTSTTNSSSRPTTQPPGSSSSSSGGAAAGRPKIMQVQCPTGAGPGQQILIMVPERGRMRVVVPPGVQPGQTFRFQLPP